jgi:hypothetical protein
MVTTYFPAWTLLSPISTSISSMDAPFWHFNVHLNSHGAVPALEEHIKYDSKKEHDEDTSKPSFSS